MTSTLRKEEWLQGCAAAVGLLGKAKIVWTGRLQLNLLNLSHDITQSYSLPISAFICIDVLKEAGHQ